MAKDEVIIHDRHWEVVRHAEIIEVTEWDDRIRWKVEVADGDRPPFLIRQFNTKEAAYHFLDKVMAGKPDREPVSSRLDIGG